jgi:hypothetical protein
MVILTKQVLGYPLENAIFAGINEEYELKRGLNPSFFVLFSSSFLTKRSDSSIDNSAVG